MALLLTSTTSTLPPSAPANAAGTWSLVAFLVGHDCPAEIATLFRSTIVVQQQGTALTGTIGIVSGAGEVLGPDSWKLFAGPVCNLDCCLASGVSAFNQVANHADAAFAIAIECVDGSNCLIGYAGSLDR